MRRFLVGLGVVAGAVVPVSLRAQVPDTTRKVDSAKIVVPARPTADTLLKNDSLKAPGRLPNAPLPPGAQAPVDSIKAPLAHSESPRTVQVASAYVWDRPALFAAGAQTLGDFIERLSGTTLLRAGYFSSPQTAAYLGQPARVRVFIDGIEEVPLNPRSPTTLDLSRVPIWSLEEIRLERGAGEIRVYARTWRDDHVTPYTRVDVATGDQQTNSYRGFYGKRWQGGEALQVGASEYGTTPDRSSSSDLLGMMARVGIARSGWSLDGFALRTGAHRGQLVGYPNLTERLRAEDATRTDAYLRAAWGDPDKGAWLQAMAGSLHFDLSGDSSNVPVDTTKPRPSPDSSAFEAQYLVTGGLSGSLGEVSAAARMHVRDGRSLLVPSARVGTSVGPLRATAYVEGKSIDSVSRAEASAEFDPLDRVALLASVGRATDGYSGTAINSTYERAEAAVRLGDLWLGGGLVRRDSAYARSLSLFDSTYAAVALPSATGMTVTARGRVWKDVGMDAWAVRWTDTAGLYRPQYQARSELYVRTRWLSRFPTGDFGLYFGVTHEYRSSLFVPVASGNAATIERVPGYRVWSTLLEIRILRAVAFWQMRNPLNAIYYQVPGFMQPRTTQSYGVRWEFWD